jgi:hypothetical protein
VSEELRTELTWTQKRLNCSTQLEDKIRVVHMIETQCFSGTCNKITKIMIWKQPDLSSNLANCEAKLTDWTRKTNNYHHAFTYYIHIHVFTFRAFRTSFSPSFPHTPSLPPSLTHSLPPLLLLSASSNDRYYFQIYPMTFHTHTHVPYLFVSFHYRIPLHVTPLPHYTNILYYMSAVYSTQYNTGEYSTSQHSLHCCTLRLYGMSNVIVWHIP